MLFKAKAIHANVEEVLYLTHICMSERVHTFLEGNSPKMNVIARLEFELGSSDVSQTHQPLAHTGNYGLIIILTKSLQKLR